MPGGGVGQPSEEEQVKNPEDRWAQSGLLEVQCLACHDFGFAQDLAQVTDQINKQNYRWAGTAACDLAWVTGKVSDLPASWQPGPAARGRPERDL